MIALACIILVGFGFGLGCIAIRLYDRSRKPDGLPCPHPMCRNILPRQGALSPSGVYWEDEECPACQGIVRFKSEHQAILAISHPNDRWVRVHRPELKS